MRDCRLECVQAVIERQKRMPAEANDDRLFLDRQHRRSRFLWSRPSVHDRAARLPLAHRLLIDAVMSGKRSQALFTMLYRSTDRLSRRGAPVKNLAHSASFDSCNKNAPSKCGTKHLTGCTWRPPLGSGTFVFSRVPEADRSRRASQSASRRCFRGLLGKPSLEDGKDRLA